LAIVVMMLWQFIFIHYANCSSRHHIPKDSCALKFYGLNAGFGLSKFGHFDIGISKMRIFDNTCDPYGTMGYSFGVEGISNFTNLYLGPKLGVDFAYFLVHFRLSSVLFLNEKGATSWIIRPEVGPTFLGYISILYGYNFQMTDGLNFKLVHQVSVRINLPKRHFRLIKSYPLRVN